MARYIERAENLARVLDVHETFSRDSRGGQNWTSVLQLYADDARFLEAHDEATAEAVIHFYMLDQANPSSVIACVHMARENARALRPLISTEMWTQLNMFYNQLKSLDNSALDEPRLARLCGRIKEACQAHTGITEGTFYRDEGWSFYQLGRNLERSDQTTRLVDVKYHLLLPRPEDVGSPSDVSQWNAVLRSAAGFHAFRRVHPSGMSPDAVADFLLFNRCFPRSVLACVAIAAETVDALGQAAAVETDALQALQNLRRSLKQETIDSVIARGLHEYLDLIQQELISVGLRLGRDFFGYAEPPDAPEEPGAIPRETADSAMNA